MAAESRSGHLVGIVRKFRPEDADAVMAIAAESPEAANWSKESYLRSAKVNGSLTLAMEAEGEVSGFLVGRQIGDQAEVFNLAVKYKHRRKGVGTALLAAALEEFALAGAKRVYLEVRESNSGGIAFYDRHGFAKTGLRKGYYREPDEAAVTMEKKLED